MNIPGTQVALTLISVPMGEHCPLFYDPSEGSLNLASVNPGISYQLYVGGKGGNGQFHDDLQDAGQQKVDDYAPRHQALAAKVTKNCGSASETYQDVDPMRVSHVQVNKLNPNSYEGVCFVDVFDPAKVPPAEIAAAIFAGYTQELQAQDSGISELQLPYSSDKTDPLFAAIQQSMTTN